MPYLCRYKPLQRIVMKKIIPFVAAALIAFPLLAKGQITLEKTYTGVSAGVAQTETYGDKFYVMDVAAAQCRVYNLDHSLWKTINLSVPAGYYLYDIQYVTDHLFNTDNSLELLYVCYTYNSTSQYYTYETRVVTETGTQLLALPGAGYNWITTVEGAGTKLFSYIYDYSQSPYTVTTQIYHLGGNLPTTTVEAGQPVAKAWPNPTSGKITIEFNLPAEATEANLIIRDATGQVARSYPVDGTFGNLIMDTSTLPSGVYFWNLEGTGFKTTLQKIVISR